MLTLLLSSLRRHIWLALMSVAAMTAPMDQAAGSLIWDWSYSDVGVVASGTFTTNDIPYGSGFYLITDITGTQNGETITGLQPAGTPIPGNEPFPVDNLIRLNTPQLTIDGFGYATSGGNFSNPFFASFLSSPGYLEFFSAPPFTPGAMGPEDSELPISFSASLTTVPEPETNALLMVGLGMLFHLRCRKTRVRRNRTQVPPHVVRYRGVPPV